MEFHFAGTEVRLGCLGRGVLLELTERDAQDVRAAFAEIERFDGGEFLPDGRPVLKTEG
jgi:hypothetical protein